MRGRREAGGDRPEAGGDRPEAGGIGLCAIAPGRLRDVARVTEAEEMAENRWLAPMRLRGCGHWECTQRGTGNRWLAPMRLRGIRLRVMRAEVDRKPLASADAANHRATCEARLGLG
jgi:hypothetical protein